MHPAVLAAIVFSGAIVLWGGYEVASRIYNEYEEHRQYEGYVRQYNEVERLHDEDNDDNDDDHSTAVGSEYLHRRYDQLRNRRGLGPRSSPSMSNSNELHLQHSSYELDEFERNLEDRRRRLVAEQKMLDQAERDLVQRQEALASATVRNDEEQHEIIPIINIFNMPLPLSSNSSVDGDEPRSPSTHGGNDDDDQSSVSYCHSSEDDHHTQDGGHSSSISYDMLTDDDFHSTY